MSLQATIGMPQVAFPVEVRGDIVGLLSKLQANISYATHPAQPAVLHGQVVWVPSRIYGALPPTEGTARYTPEQRYMLYSLLSRHSNGFVRQSAIKPLAHSPYYWTTPYLLMAVGDYVCEIVDEIYRHFDAIDPQLLAQLIVENPTLYTQVQSRVHSYWDCYYRQQFPKKVRGVPVPDHQQYVGFKLLAKINAILSRK